MSNHITSNFSDLRCIRRHRNGDIRQHDGVQWRKIELISDDKSMLDTILINFQAFKGDINANLKRKRKEVVYLSAWIFFKTS